MKTIFMLTGSGKSGLMRVRCKGQEANLQFTILELRYSPLPLDPYYTILINVIPK